MLAERGYNKELGVKIFKRKNRKNNRINETKF